MSDKVVDQLINAPSEHPAQKLMYCLHQDSVLANEKVMSRLSQKFQVIAIQIANPRAIANGITVRKSENHVRSNASPVAPIRIN